MEQILTNPDLLSNYLIGLEQELGQINLQEPQKPQQPAQQVQQPVQPQQLMQQIPSPAWPTNGQLPNFSQIPAHERWKFVDMYGRNPAFWNATQL
jgi:hypothetical protein